MAKIEHPRISSKKHLARLEREEMQKRIIFICLAAIIVLVLGVIGYGILDQIILQPMRPVAQVGDTTITGNHFQVQAQIERLNLVQQYQYFSLVAQASTDINQMIQAYTNIQTIQNRLSSDTSFGEAFLNQMIDDVIIAEQAPTLGIEISDQEIEQIVFNSQGFYPNGTPTQANTSTPYETPTISNTQLSILGPTLTPTLGPTSTLDPIVSASTTAQTQDSLITDSSNTDVANLPTLPTATNTQLSPTATELAATPTLSTTLAPEASPTVFSTALFGENLAAFLEQLESYNISEQDWRLFIEAQLLRQRVYEQVTQNVPTSAEQVWARHILVATLEEAQSVIQRYDEGENWYSLASELSLDTSNNTRGGDLGWFPRGAMVSAFEETAFNLPIGSISPPIQTDFGWHIIQVIGHEENLPLSSRYYQNNQQAAFNDWIQQFKVGRQIETYDNWVQWIPTEPSLDSISQ